ncbi:hypothetical protein TNCT_613141, partial [Trichonephila clavata]
MLITLASSFTVYVNVNVVADGMRVELRYCCDEKVLFNKLKSENCAVEQENEETD